ncbi:Putative 2-aminoethylphosphonate import ATP-binding protein PhnT [Nonomuraea coxensis DSM 45129]|uniref:2-aminoethylphosphonate import ATP-binding protein PhnT n=1 Tax=Nonomuraea coxensis DSM 45129 TaxID=1122611 RepID=A0ABX8UBX7_9ACTN|nr:ABC transporter ATP-binding protein [Nonomuraea coxensis]QYC45187.1 Putative 2-aminoethylphosphonate import ATP-binding protein PhnT [Nonomuraea coxensis DSM 45129]
MSGVLELSGIAVRFGGNEVLKGVDLSVGPGFTGLIGPNGAGKTTVFNVVTGYVRPTGGTVTIGGERIPAGRPAAVARKGVRRTFQTPRLVAELSVEANVLVGLDAGASTLADYLGLSRAAREARARVRELLEAFGLAERAAEPVGNLPLGSQKIVEVARALAPRPRVVLLDEPAAGLSAADVTRMVEPLSRIGEREELSILIIEHDLELVARLCPRIAALHFGRILAEGTPAEVVAHPDVVEAYLGAGVAAVDT